MARARATCSSFSLPSLPPPAARSLYVVYARATAQAARARARVEYMHEFRAQVLKMFKHVTKYDYDLALSKHLQEHFKTRLG